MKILIIDNYDSFTYNLVQILGSLAAEVLVFRNDSISLKKLSELEPDGIVISPGPGRPSDTGICRDAIIQFGDRMPILGVCLGHQLIGEIFGGEVVYAPSLVHGKTSEISHIGRGIFADIPQKFKAARYHSLMVTKTSFPIELLITATTEDGVIMGLKHRSRHIYGIQFHPESIMTEFGDTLLKNWTDLCSLNTLK